MKCIFNKAFLFSLFLTSIAGLFLFFFPHQGWGNYYRKKLYLPSAQVTQTALSFFSKPGLAIDFGCGCGNDTAFLLSNDWTVWALDGEPIATQILKKRKDISNQSPLFTSCEKFEETNWNNLPTANLFLAINALPFCRQENFQDLWIQILGKIESQGIFAGQFFGPLYQGFTDKERKTMTFLTKEEVLELFQDFDIEFFEEREKTGKTDTGRAIHSHVFEVIAKKH